MRFFLIPSTSKMRQDTAVTSPHLLSSSTEHMRSSVGMRLNLNTCPRNQRHHSRDPDLTANAALRLRRFEADENGKRVGPYRVWKVENLYPGIAMSRSLGDRLAHEVGVISTPIIMQRKLVEGEDLFIVLASDGLWDMMENQEVCDFVEAYRHKAQRNIRTASYVDVVQPSNVCIAHLLSEEARARWLLVVEAEDVQIDDISCLILEFVTHLPSRKRPPQRNTQLRREDTKDVPGLDKTVRVGKAKDRPAEVQKEEHNPEAREEEDTTPGVVINDPANDGPNLALIAAVLVVLVDVNLSLLQ